MTANVIADDAWTNTTPGPVDVVYTVIPVSADGCQGNPFTVTITVESTLGVGPQTVTACSDAAIGFVLGAAPNTTYNITAINPNGLTASAGNPVIGIGLPANEIADDAWTNNTPSAVDVVYTVLPVSSNGCIGQPFTVTATINPEPVVSNQVATICSDSASGVSLHASTSIAASSYTITSINSNGLTASAGNPSPGTNLAVNVIADDAWTNMTPAAVDVVYTVVPVSALGCLGNPFTVTITVNPEPVVANQTSTICSDVANGVILGNDIDTPTVVSYNITAINSNGLNASAGNPVTGIGFLANEISDDAWTNTSSFDVNVVYTVVPVGTDGCQGNAFTVTIVVESEIIMQNQNLTICSDSPTNILLSSDPTLTFNITSIVSNGLIASSGNPLTGIGFLANEIADDAWTNMTPLAGNVVYTIVPVTQAGCLGNPYTITVTVNPEPIVMNQTTNVCSGDATNITLGNDIDTPTVTSYNIIAITSNGLIATAGNPIIGTGFLANEIIDDVWENPTLLPLNVIYTIVPVSNDGCKGDAFTIAINVNPQINVVVATTPITCYGANNASITLTVTGGTSPYIATWNNLATGLFQNNLAAGTYVIQIKDARGCTKSVTVIIPEAPVFMVTPITTNISCYGAHDGSINLNLVGGIAPVSLIWSDGSTAGLIRNNLGPGTYTATISDGTPCFIVRTFTILEPQPLILSANLTNALDCNNANSGAINLMVSGGTPPFIYSWSNGSSTEDLNTIPAGNYLVTVTDARGCSKTAQFVITRPSPLTLNVNTNTTANCSTHTVMQNFAAQASGGVPPYHFNWSSGTVSGINNEFMTTTQDGMMLLTVTDDIGCTTNYTFNVSIPSIGNPTFTTTSIGQTLYNLYSIEDPIQFNSVITGNYTSVVWDFGDGTYSNELSPVHTYLVPNDYYLVTLTVTYPFGCVYVSHLALNVVKGYLMVVPTAFTPNNHDGVNDTFRPVTKGLKNVHLDVYDTWGSLIYSEEGDVLVGWDGKIKGVGSENGNYYAKVSGETFYGTIVNENHTFVLIK